MSIASPMVLPNMTLYVSILGSFVKLIIKLCKRLGILPPSAMRVYFFPKVTSLLAGKPIPNLSVKYSGLIYTALGPSGMESISLHNRTPPKKVNNRSDMPLTFLLSSTKDSEKTGKTFHDKYHIHPRSD